MIEKVPEYVKDILLTLTRAGFNAYVVGGCLRDLLLSRRPNDWDVATSAKPEDVSALFPRTVPTGLKHGTVTVLSKGRGVEVTTFRADSDYRDGRHPSRVYFGVSLSEDLSRRDFTMNALALGLDGAVIDPFGGVSDLMRGVIRCVGDPYERFSEDALRMFRALRFSAELGFPIDAPAKAAIKALSARSGLVSAERIRYEVERTVTSPRPEVFDAMLKWSLMARFIVSVGVCRAERLRPLPKMPVFRWPGLCALLLEAGLIESPDVFLRSLRLDRATVRTVSTAAAGFRSFPENSAGIMKLAARTGDMACLAAACMADALSNENRFKKACRALNTPSCRKIRDLAVGGDELLALGVDAKKIGAVLTALLDHVIDNPDDNAPEILAGLAEKTL